MRAIKVCLCGLLMLVSCGAWASDVSIHSMLLGNDILELSETRQLTYGTDGMVSSAAISPDGKIVAYLSNKDGVTSLCTVKAKGGQPSVLLKDTVDLKQGETGWALQEMCGYSTMFAWSPDSRQFAISVAQVTQDDKKASMQPCLLFVSAKGVINNTFVFPDGKSPMPCMAFGPDSHKLALSVDCPDPQETGGNLNTTYDILIIDPNANTSKQIYSVHDDLKIERWSDSGQSLLCKAFSFKNRKLCKQLRKIWLDGRPDEILNENGDSISPDGTMGLPSYEQGGVTVKSTTTGKPIATFKGSDGNWCLSNNLFFYNQENTINDSTNERTRKLNTIWLANPTQAKINTMCVALDAVNNSPTWSSNCMKMAYISQGRLYVAELAKRVPSGGEKIAYGLPLSTEEDEMEVLPNNAKEIGVALQFYANERDGVLPSEDTFQKDILQYLRNKEALLRPGTNEIAFRYMHPAGQLGEIENPSDTIIGEIYSSYSWKAVVYADSHVRIMPK